MIFLGTKGDGGHASLLFLIFLLFYIILFYSPLLYIILYYSILFYTIPKPILLQDKLLNYYLFLNTQGFLGNQKKVVIVDFLLKFLPFAIS